MAITTATSNFSDNYGYFGYGTYSYGLQEYAGRTPAASYTYKNQTPTSYILDGYIEGINYYNRSDIIFNGNFTYNINGIPSGRITSFQNDTYSISGLDISVNIFNKYLENSNSFSSLRLNINSLIFGGNDTISGVSDGEFSWNSFFNGSVLRGYAGNDVITGTSYNDLLQGDAGKDRINGGAGDDLISGGVGKDTLTGGLGSDIFQFVKYDILDRNNFDTITDFNVNDDFILIDNSLGSRFEEYGGIDDFLSTSKLANARNGEHLIFETRTNTLYFDTDGAGSGDAAIALVKLTGVTNLSIDNILTGFITDNFF